MFDSILFLNIEIIYFYGKVLCKIFQLVVFPELTNEHTIFAWNQKVHNGKIGMQRIWVQEGRCMNEFIPITILLMFCFWWYVDCAMCHFKYIFHVFIPLFYGTFGITICKIYRILYKSIETNVNWTFAFLNEFRVKLHGNNTRLTNHRECRIQFSTILELLLLLLYSIY